MAILHWGQGFQTFAESLKQSFPDNVVPGGIGTVASLEGLRVELVTKRAGLRLVVLAPPTLDALESLMSLAPLLGGLAVVIVLPSVDISTLSLVHRLHPRFVASGVGAWGDAVSVAANILKKRGETQGTEHERGSVSWWA